MKIDTRAMRRAISAFEKEIRRLAKVRDRAYSLLLRYPRPLQKKNREATGLIAYADSESQKIEAQKLKISALIDELKSCENSCSTECQTARTGAQKVVERAPKAKKIAKRAKAPTVHEQQLIAQAHLLEMMRRNDPRLRLPSVPLPSTDWQPDGPKQVAAYTKIFNDVFDGVFWEAADIAISELGDDSDDARKVAEAASKRLFAEYLENGGNVVSIDNRLRKGKTHRPTDVIFFPDAKKVNPAPRKKKRVSNPKNETLYHGTNKKDLKPYVGICLTDTRSIARQYGRNVFEVDVAPGVTYHAEIVEGYDRDIDFAPGDKGGEFDGWIEFLDESPGGKQHKTWRAMDKGALDEIVAVRLLEDD